MQTHSNKLDCDRRQSYHELNPFSLDRGVLNKVLYREVPPQGPTPYPLKYNFDKAEQICASIVHFLLKAWNLAGSPSVILILILIVLSAKGISHHGGCVIVQVLVLRYNQGANVEWIKIVIIKSSGLAFLKMAHDGRFESLHWLLFNETTL